MHFLRLSRLSLMVCHLMMEDVLPSWQWVARDDWLCTSRQVGVSAPREALATLLIACRHAQAAWQVLGFGSSIASKGPNVRVPTVLHLSTPQMCTGSSRERDVKFMRLALGEAEAAFRQGEIPVGAVLVQNDKVLALGRNRVEELQDASAHAEMLCARNAARKTRCWRLSNSTLYVTLEPCPMCISAIYAFRIRRVVYGALNTRLGAIESAMRPPENQVHPFHSLEVHGGVLAEDCSLLMKAFFRKRRGLPYSNSVTAHRRWNKFADKIWDIFEFDSLAF